RGTEPDRVFQVGERADVGEQEPEAPLAEEVDVELHRGPKPGDTDELAAGADRVDRLEQRPGPRETLRGAAAGAVENDIGAVASRELSDGGNRVFAPGIQRRVRTELAGDPAGLLAHVDGDDQPRAAVPRDLEALQAHAPLAIDRDRIADANPRRLHSRDAIAERLEAGGLAVRDPVVHAHQRDLGEEGPLGKAAR